MLFEKHFSEFFQKLLPTTALSCDIKRRQQQGYIDFVLECIYIHIVNAKLHEHVHFCTCSSKGTSAFNLLELLHNLTCACTYITVKSTLRRHFVIHVYELFEIFTLKLHESIHFVFLFNNSLECCPCKD